MVLNDAWKFFISRGCVPTEVLVNRTGEKMDGVTAIKKDVQWDVLYFRDDGYVLAADFYSAHYVLDLCTDPEKHWVGKMLRGQQKPEPFSSS
jgi:hypothetical protein